MFLLGCSNPLAKPVAAQAGPSTPGMEKFRKEYPHCFDQYGGKTIIQIVIDAAKSNGMRPTLALGLVLAESRCNTNALGAAGDTGLGQVIHTRWGRPSKEWLQDPYNNADYFTKLYVSYLRDYKGNEYGALQRYNGNGKGYAQAVWKREAYVKSALK